MQADANPTSVKIKHREINNVKIKFKVGDNVRISTQKGVFTKGYLPNWSTEIINKTLLINYKIIWASILQVVFILKKYSKLISQTNI